MTALMVQWRLRVDGVTVTLDAEGRLVLSPAESVTDDMIALAKLHADALRLRLRRHRRRHA